MAIYDRAEDPQAFPVHSKAALTTALGLAFLLRDWIDGRPGRAPRGALTPVFMSP